MFFAKREHGMKQPASCHHLVKLNVFFWEVDELHSQIGFFLPNFVELWNGLRVFPNGIKVYTVRQRMYIKVTLQIYSGLWARTAHSPWRGFQIALPGSVRTWCGNCRASSSAQLPAWARWDYYTLQLLIDHIRCMIMWCDSTLKLSLLAPASMCFNNAAKKLFRPVWLNLSKFFLPMAHGKRLIV